MRRSQEFCTDCWRRCAYSDFRDTVPTGRGGRRNIKPGPSSARRDFLTVALDTAAEVTANIDNGVGDRLTRAKILGRLRGEKYAAWDEATSTCVYAGERMPETLDAALRWVTYLGDERFRKEVLGWSHDRWCRTRRTSRAVTVRAFLRWWDSARQCTLDDAAARENLVHPQDPSYQRKEEMTF